MSATKDDTYYQNIDKRTKEYKDWKELKEMQLSESNKGFSRKSS